jgi:hypothetical protein
MAKPSKPAETSPPPESTRHRSVFDLPIPIRTYHTPQSTDVLTPTPPTCPIRPRPHPDPLTHLLRTYHSTSNCKQGRPASKQASSHPRRECVQYRLANPRPSIRPSAPPPHSHWGNLNSAAIPPWQVAAAVVVAVVRRARLPLQEPIKLCERAAPGGLRSVFLSCCGGQV